MYRSSKRILLLLMSLHADMERGLWKKERDPRLGPPAPPLASGINSAASSGNFTFRGGVLTEDVGDDEQVSSDIPPSSLYVTWNRSDIIISVAELDRFAATHRAYFALDRHWTLLRQHFHYNSNNFNPHSQRPVIYRALLNTHQYSYNNPFKSFLAQLR